MNIGMIQDLVEEDGIVFLTYGGFLTQSMISSMTEALEKEAQQNDLKMGESNNIFTVFIELTQNMMNYSKNKSIEYTKTEAEGLIVVTKDADGNYYIHSQNIIDTEDKQKIEPKLNELITLDGEQIKKRYRELRRSGRDKHGKGGGIGFYEIAKRSNGISFEFNKINEKRYYFHFIAKIKTSKEI